MVRCRDQLIAEIKWHALIFDSPGLQKPAQGQLRMTDKIECLITAAVWICSIVMKFLGDSKIGMCQINQSTGSIDELFQPRVIGLENQMLNIQF